MRLLFLDVHRCYVERNAECKAAAASRCASAERPAAAARWNWASRKSLVDSGSVEYTRSRVGIPDVEMTSGVRPRSPFTVSDSTTT